MAVSETFMKPSSMLYRNFLAMQVEEMLRSHPCDGAVLMGGCDKTTPALLMGAISADIPIIYLPCGPMSTARWGKEALDWLWDAAHAACRRNPQLAYLGEWGPPARGAARGALFWPDDGTAGRTSEVAHHPLVYALGVEDVTAGQPAAAASRAGPHRAQADGAILLVHRRPATDQGPLLAGQGKMTRREGGGVGAGASNEQPALIF